MKEEDNKFTITVSQYGGELTYTIERNRSDLTMEDLYDIFRSISLAMSYHPETVKEYFD